MQTRHDTHADFAAPHRLPLRALLAVIALWLAARLVLYGGIAASDPLEYLAWAQRIATGEFELATHHYSTRFAVTVPIAACFRLFGVSVASATLWPLACSLVTLLLLFRLGKRYGDDATGLLAATAFALLPLDIIESTNVLPDPILTTFATLSVCCFLRGFDDDLRPGRGRLWLVAAGVCLWLAYSAKIVGALLALVFFLHALTDRRRLLRLGWVALGTLLLLLPELFWYHRATGNWLLPVAAIGEVHEKSVGVQAANANLGYRLFKEYANEVLRPNEHFGWLGVPLVAAALLLLPQVRRLRMLYLWMGALFAYLNFGSSSFSRFVAIPANTRYLQPVVIPTLVLLALAARQMWLAAERWPGGAARAELGGGRADGPRERRRGWGRLIRGGMVLTGLLLAVSSLATAWLHAGRSFVHLTAREGLALVPLLRQQLPSRVYTDARTAGVIDFAFGYAPPFELRPFPTEGVAPGEPYVERFASGDLLLLNWREVYKGGPLRQFPRAVAVALRELRANPGVAILERSTSHPGCIWYAAAKLPGLREGLRWDERIEYFDEPEQPRGIWAGVVAALEGGGLTSEGGAANEAPRQTPDESHRSH